MIRDKGWLAFLTLLVLCGLTSAAAFSKIDVLQMSKSGQSDQAILDAIRSSNASFNLTADDVADLRQAGASQVVIDAMIDAGPSATQAPSSYKSEPTQLRVAESAEPEPVQPAPDEPATAQAQVDAYESPEVVEYVPVPAYYPPPWPIAYPFYPIYTPIYYPVYHPFFSFFGGFSFSFAFGNPFGFHAIFPCDHSFVVVSNRFGFNGGGYRRFGSNRFGSDRFGQRSFDRSRPSQWNTPRTYAQVAPPSIRDGRMLRAGSGRTVTVHAPSLNSSSRIAPSGPGRFGGSFSVGRSAPRVGQVGPGISPRSPSMPRVQPPQRSQPMPRFQPSPRFQAPPRFQAGPRFQPSPRFQGAPRFSGPSFHPPRMMSAPHQGYSGGGGARGGSGGFRGGGGGHRGHR